MQGTDTDTPVVDIEAADQFEFDKNDFNFNFQFLQFDDIPINQKENGYEEDTEDFSCTWTQTRVLDVEPEDEDAESDSSSGSEESESESGSEDEAQDPEQDGEFGESGIVGTFPYSLSDSDSDSNYGTGTGDVLRGWVRNLTSGGVSEIETITIESDEDIQKENATCEKICKRCPEDHNYFEDRTLFHLHRDRHQGINHFCCKTCRKPFIKLTLCLAHEIRVHDSNFPVHSPLLVAAVKYREEKKKRRSERAEQKNKIQSLKAKAQPEPQPSTRPSTAQNENPGLANGHHDQNLAGGGQSQNSKVVFELESDDEDGENNAYDEFADSTDEDEDDPKFLSGHIVPSTALYPYRGPELWALHDSYEVHLKYGRKKRTAANTIARSVLAHRQRLITDGLVSEQDIGRFWKPEIPSSQNKNNLHNPKTRPNEGKRKRGDESHEDTSESGFGEPGPASNKKKKLENHQIPQNPYKKFPSSSSRFADGNFSSATNIKAKPPKSKSLTPKKRNYKNKPKGETILNRNFVNSILNKVCLLCQFTWETQDQLRKHRDEKHVNKSILELMTVPSVPVPKPKNKKATTAKTKSVKNANAKTKHDVHDDPDFLDLFTPLTIIREARSKNSNSVSSYSSSGERDKESRREWENKNKEGELSQDVFLSALCLITREQAQEIKNRRRVPPVKFCVVIAKQLPLDDLPRSGRVFVCHGCNFFAKSRGLVKIHEREMKHQPPRKVTNKTDKDKVNNLNNLNSYVNLKKKQVEIQAAFNKFKSNSNPDAKSKSNPNSKPPKIRLPKIIKKPQEKENGRKQTELEVEFVEIVSTCSSSSNSSWSIPRLQTNTKTTEKRDSEDWSFQNGQYEPLSQTQTAQAQDQDFLDVRPGPSRLVSRPPLPPPRPRSSSGGSGGGVQSQSQNSLSLFDTLYRNLAN